MNPWLLLTLLTTVAVASNAFLHWHDRRQRARRAAARQPPDGPGSGILVSRHDTNAGTARRSRSLGARVGSRRQLG